MDSEGSIQSLTGVRYYRLESQNNGKELHDSDMLACIIEEAAKLHKNEIKHLVR